MRGLCLSALGILSICTAVHFGWSDDLSGGNGTAATTVRTADARAILSGQSLPPSTPQTVAGCKLSIVGAAYGGLYFAHRLVEDEGVVKAEDVCIFEASSRRNGGRVYTVRNLPQDPALVVDVGGYRYVPSQKLIAGLIERRLGLNSRCYYPITCEDNRRIVVDESGLNSVGFTSPMDEMMRRLVEGGARVFYGYRLTNIVDAQLTESDNHSVEEGTKSVQLEFSNGGSALSQQVMLNIPSEAISTLNQNSILFTKSSRLSHVGFGTQRSESYSKIYLQYEDAWWITKLGLFEGSIDGELNPKLAGRYHDGAVRCFDNSGQQIPLNSNKDQLARCNGLLLAAYFGVDDPTRQSYYSKFQATDDPLTIIDRQKEDERLELLMAVHNRLMEHHKEQFREVGFNSSDIEPPRYLYMANWREDNPITASFHDWPHFLPGSDFSGFIKAMLRPIPGYDIFVANEAFGVNPGWAEGSVMMAERVLALEMGIGKPSWLQDDSYYQSTVLDLEYFDLLTVQLFENTLPVSGPKTQLVPL